jgi:hypothetical protein
VRCIHLDGAVRDVGLVNRADGPEELRDGRCEVLMEIEGECLEIARRHLVKVSSQDPVRDVVDLDDDRRDGGRFECGVEEGPA